MISPSEDMKTSPEIKNMIDKLTPSKATATAQEKYQAILKRKCYDHHCFLECVSLRLDTYRGTQTSSQVQEHADRTFVHMLEHAQ
jgi:hypothetical protein